MLGNRLIRSTLGGCSIIKRATRGIPQGVLSPLLWLLESTGCQVVKYFGVFLDNKLNWKRNIEERIKKVLNALRQCRNFIGKSWGLPPGPFVGYIWLLLGRVLLMVALFDSVP